MRAALRYQVMFAPQAVWGAAGTWREVHTYAGVAGAEDRACRAGRASETAVLSARQQPGCGAAEAVQPWVQPGNSPSTCNAGSVQVSQACLAIVAASLAIPGLTAPLLCVSACLLCH